MRRSVPSPPGPPGPAGPPGSQPVANCLKTGCPTEHYW
jgi:hypothetical protein